MTGFMRERISVCIIIKHAPSKASCDLFLCGNGIQNIRMPYRMFRLMFFTVIRFRRKHMPVENDRFIKEYSKKDSVYKYLKHGPMFIDDYIGDAMTENENMPSEQAGRRLRITKHVHDTMVTDPVTASKISVCIAGD